MNQIFLDRLLDIFRSTPCQKNESDLVINVIPHLSGMNHQLTV